MDVTFGGNFLRSNVVCDSITNSLGLYTGNWNNNYNSGSDSGSSSGSGRGKAPAEAAGAAAATTTTNVSNNECICKVQDKRSSDALRRRTGVESFQFPRRCLNRAGRQWWNVWMLFKNTECALWTASILWYFIISCYITFYCTDIT